jgi:UDP-N-acetylglucosamine 2-epimerase (non-hydrolysing)
MKGRSQGGKLRQYRIAFVVGTRPEAIKIGPVAHALAALGESPHLYVTGQHPGLELADHGLDGFGATLLNCPGQPDPMLHAELVRAALRRQLSLDPLNLLVVQGDTSSALGGAFAARETGIALAHIEAGLRTYDPGMPWPEEENRVTIDRLSDLLFAPTSGNASNLHRDKIAGEVHITGNTGIDALAALAGPLPAKPKRRVWFKRGFNLLVTCHRRENWGAGLHSLTDALITLGRAGVLSDVLLPPNATVTGRLNDMLVGHDGIRLILPLSHAATIQAMREADLVLTDSGGMQEEAPYLGVPLLVLREKTERPETLAIGCAELVGTDRDRIISRVQELRRDRGALNAMRRPAMPFGDGQAASRVARHCLMFLEGQPALEESRTA